MFGFWKKRKRQQQHSTKTSRIREEQSTLAPIVEYSLYKVGIDQLPDGAVGVFLADSVDLLGEIFMRGFFIVPVVVYRMGNLYKFYNHKLILCGAVRIQGNEKNERCNIEVYGEEMQPQRGFSSRFINILTFDYGMTKMLLYKKFYNVPIMCWKCK